MYKTWAISTLSFWCVAAFLSGMLAGVPGPHFVQNGSEVQLQQLLTDLGRKNGITFTIEEALLKGQAMDPLRSARHQMPPDGADLNATLDELSRSVPNFTWQSDPNNAKIIHIIDNRLLHRQGYALDRVIDNIDFSGTVIELIDAIASKGIAVSAGGPPARTI